MVCLLHCWPFLHSTINFFHTHKHLNIPTSTFNSPYNFDNYFTHFRLHFHTYILFKQINTQHYHIFLSHKSISFQVSYLNRSIMSSVSGVMNPRVSTSSSLRKMKNHRTTIKKHRVSCSYTSHNNVGSDPYKILKIERGASESEVKKAFRKLALKVTFYI